MDSATRPRLHQRTVCAGSQVLCGAAADCGAVVLGQAKLSIWLSRSNQRAGSGCTDPEVLLKLLVRARVRLEYTYSSLVGEMEDFEALWTVGRALCELREGQLVLDF